MPTNIHDVARLAGVSIGTVSKALNNYPGVKPSTREKIIAIAKQYDFHPNPLARGLITKRSGTVGFFLNDAVRSGLLHPFFQRVIQGCKSVLGLAGYDMVLFTNAYYTEDRRANDYLRRALARHVDGVILMGMDRQDVGARELVASELPCMSIDLPFMGLRAGTVSADNAGGADQAIDYLVSLGHTKIAFVGDRYASQPGEDRRRGFDLGLRRHNLLCPDSWRQYGDFSRESGYAAMQRLLKLENRPTAVFAIGDLMALGCLDALHEAGISVPEQVSVIGFDDIELADYTRPRLTTVRQPIEEMGRLAGHALLELLEMENMDPPHIILQTELVIRESCGAVSELLSTVSDVQSDPQGDSE